jgi:hypothetical protein
VAASCGTGQATIVSTTNTTAELSQALDALHAELGCRYDLASGFGSAQLQADISGQPVLGRPLPRGYDERLVNGG